MGNIIISIRCSEDPEKKVPGARIDDDGPRLIVDDHMFFIQANVEPKTWVTWFTKAEATKLWGILDRLHVSGVKFDLGYNL